MHADSTDWQAFALVESNWSQRVKQNKSAQLIRGALALAVAALSKRTYTRPSCSAHLCSTIEIAVFWLC